MFGAHRIRRMIDRGQPLQFSTAALLLWMVMLTPGLAMFGRGEYTWGVGLIAVLGIGGFVGWAHSCERADTFRFWQTATSMLYAPLLIVFLPAALVLFVLSCIKIAMLISHARA